jgi:hypothetical protein
VRCPLDLLVVAVQPQQAEALAAAGDAFFCRGAEAWTTADARALLVAAAHRAAPTRAWALALAERVERSEGVPSNLAFTREGEVLLPDGGDLEGRATALLALLRALEAAPRNGGEGDGAALAQEERARLERAVARLSEVLGACVERLVRSRLRSPRAEGAFFALIALRACAADAEAEARGLALRCFDEEHPRLSHRARALALVALVDGSRRPAPFWREAP